MPFAVGGAGLAVAVSRLHGDIGRVYAFDLAGAACGCLLLIPALDVFGGPGALLFASGLAALAAPLFVPAGEWRRGVLSIVPLAAAATGLAVQVWHPWLDVREAKGREAERPIFSKWNSFSRVAVIDREHQDWGLSDTYKGPHVRSLYMDIDSSASTPILEGGPLDGPISYLRYEITGLAYALRAPERVLVIGPGGGRDLWTALVGGARRVEGVEVNPIIVDDVMTSRFKVFSGDVYHAPGVTVVVDDGRSYVSRSPEQFDVIQASLVDTWAATSAGAFAMTENNLYTVEAFEAYLRHLTPDGVLTITRWYADGLRLVSLAHAASKRLGWPGLTDRMFLARNGTVMTLILKNSPLSDDEVRTLAATCDRLKFGIVYAPVTASHPQPPNRNDYTRLITTDNTDRFYRTYYFDITPTTDDRPFFFHTLFPGQTTMKFDRTLLFGSGYETLRTVLVLSFVLVTVFILLPLAGFSPEPIGDVRRALAPVAYFACLGTGFMLVEIGLTQRFVLFLGHPVYSLTVILFTLLLGGGLGSALSRRVGGSPRATIAIVIPLVVVAGLVYATALPPIFAAWIGLPRAARILLSVALLLPLGVLLGMPLPAGVRILGQRPGLLAWAWGVNGATSIFGASGAILIAMNWGFGRVATIGASVYAAAWLLGLFIGSSERDENPEVYWADETGAS